ncbi:hypothetical protein HY947_00375 [Candidatus Gottesmanbacteria bacterium]|nr:hypothetical protein [Candidatus Gottesmanbacteria bacterium]
MKIIQHIVNRWLIRESSLPKVESLAENNEVITTVVSNIGLISFSIILIVLEIASMWDRFISRTDFYPVPFLFWSKYLAYPQFLELITACILLFALIGAMLYRSRLGHLCSFLALALYQSMILSFGGSVHQTYPFLYATFLFLFLPDLSHTSLSNTENRKKTILLFIGAQAFLLLFYTMSGVEKIIEAVFQTMRGEISILHPTGMSMLLSDWSIFTLKEPMFIHYILNFPLIGWLGMIAVVYLETFAITILFKPELQKIWGACLLLFHVSTIYSMNVAFFPFLLLINALLLSSPFTLSSKSNKLLLTRLPLIGKIFRLLHIL